MALECNARATDPNGGVLGTISHPARDDRGHHHSFTSCSVVL